MILRSKTRERSQVRDGLSALVMGLTLMGSFALLSGCGESDERCSVSGRVTFKGNELKDGYLVLRPLESGQTFGTKIRQGQYHVARKNGVLPGQYRVEIKAMRPIGDKYVDSETGKETQDRVQFLPARYNTQSELTMNVTLESVNKFDFELEE